MNIKYHANLGESKITDALTPTSEMVYYRTLRFDCPDLCSVQVDKFTQFLDSKIELSKVEVSGRAVVLVAHNADEEPNYQITDHIMTLIGARILTCDSLRWGFVPRKDYTGYRFTIHLPTTDRRIHHKELFGTLRRSRKSSYTESKSPHIWSRILALLKVRKRRYNINCSRR